ncbi:MAG: NAD(P)/FAD-dependent oxidoreductase [Clostridia bacterium]|nr:NAD(P)/FAD-dependent oxidoreductase [Clostridia bacterium]
MQTDILIIGAGVVGCALARVLSRYEADIVVAEAGPDVASGATRANSGIVHAGFDAKPGSLKAVLNVRGAGMYPQLSQELGFPYRQCGALVLGFTPEDEEVLHLLLEQGKANGVPGVCLLGREEVLRLEPNTNPDVRLALYAPTSGITSPYEAAYAMADHAAVNGVRFLFGSRITGVRRGDDGLWHARLGGTEIVCRILVNCAGMGSAEIHNSLCSEPLRLIPRRGQYHLLDRTAELPFSRTMFQCPTRMGKGVLVSPTVHGNLLLGPSAEDIEDADDTATTADVLSAVLETCRLTWPGASVRGGITNFAGIRAHEEKGDFVIGAVPGQPGAYETVGIESPGLSAAPAIAEMLGAQIAADFGLAPKARVLPPVPMAKRFAEMTDEERARAVAEDPAYGRVVCRCEVVTEAEIRQAIRRPVGAASIDAVKRRTRAGMGRCQGGFCSPRVAEILSEELCIPLTQVTKFGGGSRLLTGTLRQDGEEAVL